MYIQKLTAVQIETFGAGELKILTMGPFRALFMPYHVLNMNPYFKKYIKNTIMRTL
jgi:hypothetical protein